MSRVSSRSSQQQKHGMDSVLAGDNGRRAIIVTLAYYVWNGGVSTTESTCQVVDYVHSTVVKWTQDEVV